MTELWCHVQGNDALRVEAALERVGRNPGNEYPGIHEHVRLFLFWNGCGLSLEVPPLALAALGSAATNAAAHAGVGIRTV